jgi:tape measure domain-containing protein
MATIDDKVVAMSFESSKFESGVNKTLTSLDKLKSALHFPNAGKGLQQVGVAAKQVDLGHIGKGIEDVKHQLSAFRLAAIAVLAQVAQHAVAAGSAFAKSFTLDPIKVGFAEYTTNLNAVQTILANTQAAGVGIKDVNATLRELNEYSDKTIYNFSQMAKNIGTFTAAGVELDTATGAIKGIANLAALSGSNAEQAATAMYQLSQAISAGRVSLMDWNSVVNAGMGGTVFQRALAQTAVSMGTLKEDSLKLVGPMKNVSIAGESFRQSLAAGPGKDSWLTSKVLTSTLEQFTGDLTDAELKAQGFNEAQIAAIQRTAETAMKAATEVKTLSGLLTVARETAGSGWAQTWQIIFGDFGEAKKLFTGLSNAINGFITANSDARNKVLSDWKKLGGRTLLIDSLKTAFQNLAAVVKPIKDAFRDIFPATTGKDLYDLTVRFSEFVKTLKPTPTTVENLRRTFRGLFAVFSIAKQIIGGILSVFARLFGAVGEGSGSFLNFTGSIGDFLVSVDQALKKGGRLNKFFEKVGDILVKPIELLGEFKDALTNLFGGFSSGGFTAQMSPVQKVIELISDLWGKLLVQMGKAGEIIAPLLEAYVNFFEQIGVAIVKALSNMNFDAVLQVVRTGLFAGIFLMFKNFLGKGSLLDQFGKGFAGGIMANISRSFGALSGSMQLLQGTMVGLQQNLKAKTLKEIALAIALLAVSVLAISLVDPKRLSSSLTAITVMFGQLLGAMAILNKVVASAGFIKLPIVAASLILLAGAINVLTLSVVALSFLSWESLLKGLSGVAAMMTTLVVAAGPLSAAGPGMIRAGAGMLVIATALRIMALAVKAFGEMNLGDLAKGLGSVAASLAIIVRTSSGFSKGMVAAGAGLILIATALRILAEAVEKFGGMDMATIGKGMLGIGAGLIIVAVAMSLMPKGMILQAAGLLLVAAALQGVARAVGIMGGMSLEELGKGLGALAVSLTLLGLALIVMKGSFGASASLILAATGIAILASALKTMGSMSWGSMLKSFIVLASALALIGAAGLLLTPAIPSLLAFGAALLLIGGGLALAGAGIALIGVGLSALVVSGPAAFGILLAALVEFQQGIIESAKLLILGLLEIVKSLAAVAPQFVDSLVKILNSLLDVVIQSAPKFVQVFQVMLNLILQFLANNQDRLIQAGFDLLIALLEGIRNNIGEIVVLVVDIITNLLRGIANNIGRVIRAGVQLLTAFLRGIASGMGRVVTAAISIVTRFLTAIANNLGKVAAAGLSILTKLLKAIAGGLGRVIKAGTDVIVAFITGVGNAGPRIIAAATNAIIKFINALGKNSVKLADAGMKAIISFLNGMADAIDENAPQMRAAGFRVGVAIVDGMTFGMASKAGELAGKARSLGTGALNAMKSAVGAKSPSTEAYKIGQFVVQGLANGLADSTEVTKSAIVMGNSVIGAVEDIFQITSPSKVMVNIGRLITAGLAKGIKEGSEEDIKQAYSELNTQLAAAMTLFRTTIATERAKIREERKEDKPNYAAIRASQDIIARNETLLRRATAAQKEFNKSLKDEKQLMIAHTKEHARLTSEIEKQTDKLKDLTRTRDDAFDSFKRQYGELPDVTPEDAEGKPVKDPVGAYTTALRTQIEAVTTYAGTLQQLRGLGLDDATYNKLLAEGPEAQAFASQLLAGGATAVQSLGALSGQLETASSTLASQASANLYQAGVDAQQGLVNGLTGDLTKLTTAMETLATAMITALKKKLKIKSPSEEFAKLGKFSMEGMAKGFNDSSAVVTDAIDQSAQDALVAMKKSMKDISDVVTDELNPNPTITPILDLTQVKSKAAELAALTNTVPITAAASYGYASMISAEQARIKAEQIAAPGGTSVKFEQNNYSPEALTEVEIYRQTKNQLSQLKSALALT